MDDEVEIVEGDESRYEVGRLMAYQGKRDCTSLRCRRMYLPGSKEMGECLGWHCAVCDEPSSQYGHPDCAPKEGTDASAS